MNNTVSKQELNNPTWLIAIFSFLMLAIPIALLAAPSLFLKVSKYDILVDSVTARDGIASYSLPLSRLRNQNDEPLSFSGFIHPFINTQMKYKSEAFIYIPYFQGQLKLFYGEEILFNSANNDEWHSGFSMPDLLLKLPQQWQKNSTPIEIVIKSSTVNNVTLSPIFFGPEKTLLLNSYRNDVYYKQLPSAFLGALIVALLVLLSLFSFGSLKNDALAPILVFVALVILNIGSVGNAFPLIIELYPYLMAFMPLAFYGLIQFSNNIFDDAQPPVNKNQLLIAFAAAGLLLLLGSGSRLDMQYTNLYLNNAFLVATIIFTLITSIYRFFRHKRVSSAVLAGALITLLISVGHDVALRFGILDGGHITILFSQIALTLCVFILYLNKIARSRIELAEKNAALLAKSHETKERLHLQSELHDGVLNYLSMINIIAEEGDKTAMPEVGKLSRFAIDEIRIILNAKSSNHYDIVAALAVLRDHLTNSQPENGAQIQWSLLPLLNYNAPSSRTALEIIRIFQEASHNALVRSRCKKLVITSEETEKSFIIVIENTGGKTLTEFGHEGFGINNMKARAHKIGADFMLKPKKGGATLKLSLPK